MGTFFLRHQGKHSFQFLVSTFTLFLLSSMCFVDVLPSDCYILYTSKQLYIDIIMVEFENCAKFLDR